LLPGPRRAHLRVVAPEAICRYGLGLRSPARVSFLSGTDYMRPEQVQDLVENLESHGVQIVHWCPDLDTSTRPDDHLGPLRDYLRSHYHPVGFPKNPILVRNAASPTN
jgi:hypothetical protein